MIVMIKMKLVCLRIEGGRYTSLTRTHLILKSSIHRLVLCHHLVSLPDPSLCPLRLLCDDLVIILPGFSQRYSKSFPLEDGKDRPTYVKAEVKPQLCVCVRLMDAECDICNRRERSGEN